MRQLVGTALTVVLAATAASADVTVDYDPMIDFSHYTSFAWQEGTPAQDSLVEKKIRAAVDRELIAKGFKKTRDSPDLYVVTHASVETQRQIDVTEFGYWGGYRGWRRPHAVGVEVWDSAVGTVIVDILDAESGELIWRGVGTGNVAKKPKKRDEKINKGAAKMFKKFPPK